MWQSMLEDRFQLKAHLETREMPIYNLVVGKDGPKIKKSEDQTPPPITAASRQPCSPAPADQQGLGPLGLPARRRHQRRVSHSTYPICPEGQC